MRSDYPKPVTYIRALTLICFSFGLFVQVAAQAAVPQIEVAGTTDCAEMVQGMPNHPMPGQVIADKDKVDQHGPCREMTLDCLVAMNCLPPLALTAAGLAQQNCFLLRLSTFPRVPAGSRASRYRRNCHLHNPSSPSSISRAVHRAACELDG